MKFAEIPFERIERNFFSTKENEAVVTLAHHMVRSKGTTVGVVYGSPAVIVVVPSHEDIMKGAQLSVSYFDGLFFDPNLNTIKDWSSSDIPHLTLTEHKGASFIDEGVMAILTTVRLIEEMADGNKLLICSIDKIMNKKPKYRNRFLQCTEGISAD